MGEAGEFFKEVQKHPDRFYLIHYSSQSLYDAEAGAQLRDFHGEQGKVEDREQGSPQPFGQAP